jgi:hypothetical protein
MLYYHDGHEVRLGDSVRHASAEAVVETVIEGDEVARWDLEAPGFMILCTKCGRVLIEPGSYDWEDVSFVGREA